MEALLSSSIIIPLILALLFFSRTQRKQMSESLTSSIVHTSQLADETAKNALASSKISNLSELNKDLSETGMNADELFETEDLRNSLLKNNIKPTPTKEETK